MTLAKDDLFLSLDKKDNKRLPEQFLDATNRIKVHREQADLFSTDLDLQRRRFDLEKSLLGKAAAGFTVLPWWVKSLIALVIGGLAAAIGLIIATTWAIILPILVLTIYSFLAYLFNDYTTSDENRFTQLSEGLVCGEAEMKRVISEFQTAENDLFELIGKLNEFGQANVEVIDKYNAQIALLAEKVERYEAAVLQFEQLNATLGIHTESIRAIDTSLEKAIEGLPQQFEQMRQNTDDVELATQQLQSNISDLKTVSLSLTVMDSPCISNHFEKLLDGGFEQTEEERQEEQERFTRAGEFLVNSDAFILEMGSFLNQRRAINQRCLGSVAGDFSSLPHPRYGGDAAGLDLTLS